MRKMQMYGGNRLLIPAADQIPPCIGYLSPAGGMSVSPCAKHRRRRRAQSAMPLTPSTVGMLDGGEGAIGSRAWYTCISPFARGEQAHRAQGSRVLAVLAGDAVPVSRSQFTPSCAGKRPRETLTMHR